MTHIFEDLYDRIEANNQIPAHFYDEYDVKRGLRNADGSGVLAGLTKISSVIGVEKTDKGSEPVMGRLSYRGIPIEELVEKTQSPYRYEDSMFLLLVGESGTPEQRSRFIKELVKERYLDQDIITYAIKGLPSPNIMNKMQTVISSLYAKDPGAEDVTPIGDLKRSLSLLAKLPLILAYSYLAYYEKNPQFVEVPTQLSQAEALLYALRQGKTSSKLEIDILDLCLMLHAEHGGGNNSTFTTYVVSSTGTDIYSAVVAAMASLKGPLHGAANKKVMDMMADVKSHVSNWADDAQVSDYLEKIINKEAHDGSGKIYGLGHAVYTKSDPRAIILKSKAQALADSTGRRDEYNLYCAIERLAPALFQKIKGSDKVIAANVDFFSGFVYDCLGIPEEVYTPMFAVARTAGWLAHRLGSIISPGARVIRPAYKYVK